MQILMSGSSFPVWAALAHQGCRNIQQSPCIQPTTTQSESTCWKMLCPGDSQAGSAPAGTRNRAGLWGLVLWRCDIEGQVCHTCGNFGLLSPSERE